MDARARRKLEMGQNSLAFCLSHPAPGAGYNAAVTRLAECMARSKEVAARQDEGQRVRTAAVREKQRLRRTLTQTHLRHVVEVARVAAGELPQGGETFVLRPSRSYLGFTTVARNIATEAQANREILVRHGLGDEVLDSLVQMLDRFDAALEQTLEARRRHVGASAELKALAEEVVLVVRALDGLIRYRFAGDAETLAAWESASNVAGPFRPAKPEGTPPAGPEAHAA